MPHLPQILTRYTRRAGARFLRRARAGVKAAARARPAPPWLLKQRIYSQSGANPLIFNKSLSHTSRKSSQAFDLIGYYQAPGDILGIIEQTKYEIKWIPIVSQFECRLWVKAEIPDPRTLPLRAESGHLSSEGSYRSFSTIVTRWRLALAG
jgi:hypothetical protein